MTPQPLSRVKKVESLDITENAVEKRPALCGMVMRIIATWSQIELEFFQLTASFLKADFEIVTKMLLAITSTEARRAAMDAAAEHALAADKDALAIFGKLADTGDSCRN